MMSSIQISSQEIRLLIMASIIEQLIYKLHKNWAWVSAMWRMGFITGWSHSDSKLQVPAVLDRNNIHDIALKRDIMGYSRISIITRLIFSIC